VSTQPAHSDASLWLLVDRDLGVLLALDDAKVLTNFVFENVILCKGISRGELDCFLSQDVDECVEGSHNCPTLTALCVNNYGSFDCRPYPTCPPGHRFSVEARFCQGSFNEMTTFYQGFAELKNKLNTNFLSFKL